METGKVEFAPDYKSAKRNKPAIKLLDEWLSHPVVGETQEAERFRKRVTGELNIERERLRTAVVETAKGWRDANLNSSCGLIKAVDALIAFEAEHKIGE